MDLIRTRDGNFYEIFEVKEGEWMIKNQAGEKKKVVSFGAAQMPTKGSPVIIEHKDREISTQAIVDIFKRI